MEPAQENRPPLRPPRKVDRATRPPALDRWGINDALGPRLNGIRDRCRRDEHRIRDIWGQRVPIEINRREE